MDSNVLPGNWEKIIFFWVHMEHLQKQAMIQAFREV